MKWLPTPGPPNVCSAGYSIGTSGKQEPDHEFHESHELKSRHLFAKTRMIRDQRTNLSFLISHVIRHFFMAKLILVFRIECHGKTG